MTARLPIPGQDDGTWGDVLNNFLAQTHNTDGSLASNVVKTAQLQDGSVSAPKLASGAVNNASIVTGAGIDQSKIAGLTSALAAKADDSSVVHLAASETITGTKTFSTNPVAPTPTVGSHIAIKSYVDSVAGSGSTPDADASTKGKIQLTGDLSGTAGSPTVPGALKKASNLSDLNSAATARTNLGLGTAATQASTAFAPAVIQANCGYTYRLVYTSGAYPARPSSGSLPAGLAEYVGPTQPTDWLTNDTWRSTT